MVLDGEQVIGQGSGSLPTLISKTLNINLASSVTHFIFAIIQFAAPNTTVPTSVFTQPTAARHRQADLPRAKTPVRRYNKRGMVAGGMLPGFAHYNTDKRAGLCRQGAGGELFDPTLTFQLKEGFVVRGLLENYSGGQRPTTGRR